MKRIEIWTLLLAVVLLAAITCDNGDTDEGEPDASAQADTGGQASDADADADGDQDGEDAGEAKDNYPPPPYGITMGATVENMRFSTLPCECVEKCDGQPRQYVIECGEAEPWEFKDFFNSEDKILVLYVGAGW